MVYESLDDVIEFPREFNFSNYYDHEKKLLLPLLINKGFTNIRFGDGERDSFGPLSRIAHCTDKDGNFRHLVYG